MLDMYVIRKSDVQYIRVRLLQVGVAVVDRVDVEVTSVLIVVGVESWVAGGRGDRITGVARGREWSHDVDIEGEAPDL
jgi:hypothetical protein